MNETKSALPAKIGGTEITRFNALRHGVLSRYTVLPWEDAVEYRDLVASLVAEHAPHGPTEEHLVEELAGILWRKRRLRLAEAAAHRHGLEDALSQSHRTAKRAVVHNGDGQGLCLNRRGKHFLCELAGSSQRQTTAEASQNIISWHANPFERELRQEVRTMSHRIDRALEDKP